MNRKPMHQTLSTFLSAIATAALLTGFVACSKNTETKAKEDSPVDPRIEAVFLASEPSGAVTVIEARAKSKPGDEVTIAGCISGAMEPFTAGFATFVLGDHSLALCNETPDDSCPTPWDACCETPEKIKASRLAVQVPGENGRPVAQTLKGAGGLTELDEVVVTGTVSADSTPENLIINATGIFRKSS